VPLRRLVGTVYVLCAIDLPWNSLCSAAATVCLQSPLRIEYSGECNKLQQYLPVIASWKLSRTSQKSLPATTADLPYPTFVFAQLRPTRVTSKLEHFDLVRTAGQLNCSPELISSKVQRKKTMPKSILTEANNNAAASMWRHSVKQDKEAHNPQ
jgi:hypothetical protein